MRPPASQGHCLPLPVALGMLRSSLVWFGCFALAFLGPAQRPRPASMAQPPGAAVRGGQPKDRHRGCRCRVHRARPTRRST
eukprot:9554455-Lingulodinium_polyedra.AAC.1